MSPEAASEQTPADGFSPEGLELLAQLLEDEGIEPGAEHDGILAAGDSSPHRSPTGRSGSGF